MTRDAISDDALLKAVADFSRRRVLDLILAYGEATPTALAAELPFTRQAVAKHLAVLDRAGLVEARRTGREVRYSVRPENLDVAARAMVKVAARWDARLEAIKSLAEARAGATGANTNRPTRRREAPLPDGTRAASRS
jgi:DNA-binding transcriptional ArsR family regulator